MEKGLVRTPMPVTDPIAAGFQEQQESARDSSLDHMEKGLVKPSMSVTGPITAGQQQRETTETSRAHVKARADGEGAPAKKSGAPPSSQSVLMQQSSCEISAKLSELPSEVSLHGSCQQQQQQPTEPSVDSCIQEERNGRGSEKQEEEEPRGSTAKETVVVDSRALILDDGLLVFVRVEKADGANADPEQEGSQQLEQQSPASSPLLQQQQELLAPTPQEPWPPPIMAAEHGSGAGGSGESRLELGRKVTLSDGGGVSDGNEESDTTDGDDWKRAGIGTGRSYSSTHMGSGCEVAGRCLTRHRRSRVRVK